MDMYDTIEEGIIVFVKYFLFPLWGPFWCLGKLKHWMQHRSRRQETEKEEH